MAPSLFQAALLIIAVMALQLPSVTGYPTGAPASACESMNPTGHNTQAQSSTAPFSISTSVNEFEDEEDTITVTISVTDGGNFKGYFVQAREADGSDTSALGSFTAGTGQLQRDCGDAGAITHSESSDKTSASFTWTAGETRSSIKFYATIVRQQDTYWMQVMSETVTFNSAAVMVPSLLFSLLFALLVAGLLH